MEGDLKSSLGRIPVQLPPLQVKDQAPRDQVLTGNPCHRHAHLSAFFSRIVFLNFSAFSSHALWSEEVKIVMVAAMLGPGAEPSFGRP